MAALDFAAFGLTEAGWRDALDTWTAEAPTHPSGAETLGAISAACARSATQDRQPAGRAAYLHSASVVLDCWARAMAQGGLA